MSSCRRSATAYLVASVWNVIAHGGDVPGAHRIFDLQGGRDLGEYEPSFLGLANRELRVLGRDRTRRYTHFRDPVFVPPKLANKHQPGRRSDDDFRSYLCGYLSWNPRRSSLAGFLVASLP